MDPFRTQIQLAKLDYNITHKDSIFSIGSCFSQDIIARLSNLKFKTLSNPFGIIFHPLAIENAILRIHSEALYQNEEVYKYKELYLSWDHHSSYNDVKQEQVIKNINNNIIQARDFLQNTSYMFITLGTSIVYKLKSSEITVANCHKVPSKHFIKEMLTTQEIIQSLKTTVSLLNDIANKKPKIVFTLSPVRHIKNGIIENSLSKARLLDAIHYIVQQNENCEYFPSYEILMDDLRDYRFYNSDLLHPNTQAQDYIFTLFQDHYFNEETKAINNKIAQINTSLNHKVLHPKTLSYKEFIYKVLKKIVQLENEIPYITFSKEKANLKKKLDNAY